jgi:rhodanese-related sulfurtransferase
MKTVTVRVAAMWLLTVVLGMASTLAMAIDVKLTDYLAYVDVEHAGKQVRIQRIQDQENVLTDGFAKTSRKCPPFCIQPMSVAPGVTTVGEAEIFRFMDHQLAAGTGMIVDARTPTWHAKGTIPGSVNIPFTQLAGGDDDPETIAALEKIGGVRRGEVGWMTRSLERLLAALGLFDAHMKTDKWDFSNAKDLIFWCNGPWCGQSPRAIKALLGHGFPAEKVAYYRGGMQMWKILGLTVVVPDEKEADSVAMK